ncbi:regulator [Vibrio galatheae]|uniref:Regulator n=1 Tax=Vibrio galatheae TaxID=579748 RepID=A0A0F4NNH8_9VIBR|nr:response regulator transcription factor [Vibrio galatheae]KJY84662.1 regulator [Vibrio galatheae]
MSNLHCLVFDDHPLVGIAIRETLSKVDCIQSISVAHNTKQALQAIRSGVINLLILDINLNDVDGYDFYRRIRSHDYSGKVLFYSAEESPLYSDMAFKAGADGYVCKSEHPRILRDAVEGISNGYTFFKFKPSPNLDREKVELSNREAMVMNYLLQGKTNKEIAHILSISDKTVSTYKRRLLDKYGVNNIIELNKASTL